GVDRVHGEPVRLAVGQPGDLQRALVGADVVGLAVGLHHVLGDGRAVRRGRLPTHPGGGVAGGGDDVPGRPGLALPRLARRGRRGWRVLRRVAAEDVVGELVHLADVVLVVDHAGRGRVR